MVAVVVAVDVIVEAIKEVDVVKHLAALTSPHSLTQ
jgi:hypothetical protein